MPPARVLLSCPPDSPADELRSLIAAAGFAIVDHQLGSAPAVDCEAIVVAVIEVGPHVDMAVAQTRRWRAEWGDHFIPILWVTTPDQLVTALTAGAEAVAAQPLNKEALIAQIHALARVHALTTRLASRLQETRLLGDQLRQRMAQLDHEHALARHIHATFVPPRLPEVGTARFYVGGRPGPAGDSDFYNVFPLDEQCVGFLVGDVVSSPVVARSWVRVFVHHTVRSTIGDGQRSCVVAPAEILTAVNRQVLASGGDEPPLVALLVGLFNAQSGELTLARAGLPPPVLVPEQGPLELWNSPGPFLGTADMTYESLTKTLRPGDRLLIGTDGTRPDGDPGPVTPEPLEQAASRHRTARGAELMTAIVRELLIPLRHGDDMTLVMLEMESER
ncbi:MAG: fused response regulator/phosphatase [Gemmataceae bacterium]|nr:fused response regulator/phosphatase [Gemmata sp.]MDW8198834.1 fused response regulator/phosphatase [Gemmataceae bacterium]